MKAYLFTLFVLVSNYCISQDSIMAGMGSKNFDHLYEAIKGECGYETEYSGVKFNKKKVKEDLWVVSIVDDIVGARLNIKEADSILKKRGIHTFVQPYNKSGYDASKITINGTYIKFSVISATRKDIPMTYLGATLNSTYQIHCKSNPLFVIPSVDVDVDFFKDKVMKKITCRYQVFNNVDLGAAEYMWNELHFIF